MERYDIAIIGTGPAGLEAAITARIRNKKIILFGNKNLSLKVEKAHTIQNYLGLPDIGGEELKAAYEQSIDCFLLPQGKIVTSRHPAIYGRFTIRNGNVYETHAGPLHHEKRTKAAK